jgi:hypothetical protein
MNKAKIMLLTLPAFLLPCCTMYGPVEPEVGHYYINPDAQISTVGKTVVFELDNHSERPELSIELTDAITDAVRKRHLFSLNILYRADPAWRNLDLNDTCSYSLEELSAIRKQLRADAVLFGRVTQYYPYPHMLVGLHLKLIDLRNGKLLWATEQVWDSTDKRVERRMRVFFNSQMRAGFEPLNWELFITSPRAFNKFVACEVAQTLPANGRYVSVRSSSEKVGGLGKAAMVGEKTLKIPQKTLKFGQDVTRIGTEQSF